MDAIIVIIYGLVLGSFYNVVALRGLAGESLNGRSRCPDCGDTLRVWNLVPVLSYVLQRGKCTNCGNPISKLYPLMESIVGISFAMAYMYHGFSWECLVAILMFTMLSIGAITDYIEGVVLDYHTWPIGVVICLLVLITYPRGYLNVMTGAAVSIGLLYCVKKQKLGMGDVVIISTVFVANGLILGDLVMFLSATLALVFCVVLKHKKIRFIPFWLAGYFLLYLLLNMGLLDKLTGA